MNSELLLKYYDRISEAPDAIARLRRFILDLAVRGKLVEQNSEDEPASELIKRIVAEQKHSVRLKNIRRQVALPQAVADQFPFEIPKQWFRIPLGSVIHIVSGQHLQPNEYSEIKGSGLPYTTGPADFGRDGLKISRYALVRKAVANKGQILLTVKGSGVGKTAICDLPEVAISRQLMAIREIGLNQKFLLLVMYQLSENLKQRARSLIPGICREDVEQFVFALPPLAEQHRIVAKVDELMALCDRLEAARTKREETRNRFSASTLVRLNSPDPDPNTFVDHARFALDNISTLTTHPDQVKQLRQTILNLAVRGKLVPQDSNDEPVSAILERKGERPLDASPFVTPLSWRWLTVKQIGDTRLGKMLDKAKNKGTPHRYLRNVNVRWFDFDLSDVYEMPFEDDELEEFSLNLGDVLICEGGEPGRAAVWDKRENDIYFQKAIHRLRFVEGVNPHYFAIVLRESADSGRLATYFTGVGIKHFTGKGLASFAFPVPPLAEQHRIVTKVNELMCLCDQLEEQLHSATAINEQLLEAVLHEALAPAA